jgi:hypothetical protein
VIRENHSDFSGVKTPKCLSTAGGPKQPLRGRQQLPAASLCQRNCALLFLFLLKSCP